MARGKQAQQDRAVITHGPVTSGPEAERSSALVTAQQATQVVEADLNNRLEDLGKALAGRMDPRWYTSAVLSQFRRTPRLWSVTRTQQGRVSVIAAVMEAANVGLPFLMGRAYLVPFSNHGTDEAQLILGYQGLVDKVTGPSTDVTYVEGAVVYGKDEFDFQRGTGGYLHHREYIPDDGSTFDRGPRRAVWVRVVFANGQDRWDVWDMARVEAIRARSRAKDSGPWVTDYDEMAKKSLLRNITKTLRIDFQLMQLLDREDAWEAGGAAQAQATSAQGRLRQQVQAKLGADMPADEPQQATADTEGQGGAEPPHPAEQAPAAGAEAQEPSVDTRPHGEPDGGPARDSVRVNEVEEGLWRVSDEDPMNMEAPAPDACRAKAKAGSTVVLCGKPKGHAGPHSDGQHDWPAGE